MTGRDGPTFANLATVSNSKSGQKIILIPSRSRSLSVLDAMNFLSYTKDYVTNDMSYEMLYISYTLTNMSYLYNLLN